MSSEPLIPLPVLPSARLSEGKDQIVEVAFKGNRHEYFVTDDDSIKAGEYVIVDAERGQDLGKVRTTGGIAAKKCTGCASDKEESEKDTTPTQAVARRADPSEVQKLMVLRADEERVRRKARELVDQHSLRMKITEAEWQWDKNKLTLYFTAERRVDFRELVRELARTFRTRIELRQIGVRDEAALLGGVGRCGRELCCNTWLREIKPVSLQLAKDQNLSLNPSQISGTCGRLMCCLTYEHDAYLAARKRFPREGKIVKTAQGPAKVISIDIWHDELTLLSEDRQRRVVKLGVLRSEMEALQEAEAEADDGTGPTGKRRRRSRSRPDPAQAEDSADA